MNKGKKWTNRYSYQFEGIQNPYVVGDYIVTSGTDKSYCIVLDRNFNLVGSTSPITCTARVSDELVAIGSCDSIVRLWNAKESKLVYTFYKYKLLIEAIFVNIDGSVMTVGNTENIIAVLDHKTYSFLVEFHSKEDGMLKETSIRVLTH